MPRKKTIYKFAKIACWNIHGAYYLTNNFKINKLLDPTFLNTLNSHDILCLQETHCGQSDNLKDHITHFDGIPHCRKISSNNKYYGGMLLFIRKTIRKGIKIITTGDPDILGARMDKEFFGMDEDVILWFAYAPPLTSPYTKSRENVISSLEELLTNHKNNLILGDLNGRTSTEPDYIQDDNDKHSPTQDIAGYHHDTPLPRNNCDNARTDQQGRTILELCQTQSLRILNGRIRGDRWGKLTRFPLSDDEKPSTLDYALCSVKILPEINSFFVSPPSELSDHSYISLCLSTPALQVDRQPPLEATGTPCLPKFDAELCDGYRDRLTQDRGFDELLRNMNSVPPTQDHLDAWMTDFNTLITDNVKASFTKPNKRKVSKNSLKNSPKRPAKWFKNECIRAKKLYKCRLRKVNKNPFDTDALQRCIASRKEYRSVCRKAEASFRRNMTEKLMTLDSTEHKKFWKTVQHMRKWGNDEVDPSSHISEVEWRNHFSDLLNKTGAKLHMPECITPNPAMDAPLAMEELTEALGNAKTGKTFGPDLIYIEHIKNSPDNVIRTLLKLFNSVYCDALYPKVWTVNFLKPLYKKDAKDDPDNYRGLAIASALSKLYSMVLLQRLESIIATKSTLASNQIANRKGYRSADHVFLLKTLIDKSTRQNKKLYAAFIDFKKAYDTVNRNKLLNTLNLIGIGDRMMKNIGALYSDVRYAIKLEGKILDPISSNLGLKQGCPLSPLLFNLYINDIGTYLNSTPEPNLTLQGELINHFLYADDLVILSESKEGLQEQLNRLHKFATDKDLTVNAKKSMIMIFNRAGRLLKEKLSYNEKELKVVQSFPYLGIDISASGSLTAGAKHLRIKARKAMYSLFKTILQFQLSFSNTVKLFHTYIEPIILYNVENWAVMTNSQIKNLKEGKHDLSGASMCVEPTTTQLKFLKFALGVKKHCPTLAVLGEAAEIPLALTGCIRMLTYWNRTREMDVSTLVKKAYLENLSSNSNWCQTIQILNANLGLHSRQKEIKNFAFSAKRTMRDLFIRYWEQELQLARQEQGGRRKFYAQTKKRFQTESYLSLPVFQDRQRITKLISSTHNLEIEKGRHQNIDRDRRKCTMCDLDLVEDENHFILHCPAYTNIRTEILHNKAMDSIEAGNLLDVDPLVITKYLREAMKVRDHEKCFHVSSLSIDSTKMILKRGRGPRLTNPQLSHVSHTSLSATSLTLKKGKKTTPRYRSSPRYLTQG